MSSTDAVRTRGARRRSASLAALVAAATAATTIGATAAPASAAARWTSALGTRTASTAAPAGTATTPAAKAAPGTASAASAPAASLRDTFERTVTGGWGAAGGTGAYALEGPLDTFAVAGGKGQLRLPSRGSGHTVVARGVGGRDTDTRVSVATDKAATGFGQLLAVVARRSSAGEYRVRVRFTSAGEVRLSATRRTAGAESLVGGGEPVAAGLRHVPGNRYQLRVQVAGAAPTTLRAKVWAAGAAEPAAWTLTTPHPPAALAQAGEAGLFAYVGGDATNAPVAVSVDDLSVAPVVEHVLTDTFSRTATGGWGSAELGGAWTAVGPLSTFSVQDGAGALVLPAKGSGHTVVAGATSALDTDTTVTVGTDKVATGFGQMAAVVARRTTAGEYRVRVRFAPDKRVRLSASKRVSGAETIVGGVEPTVSGAVHAPGQRYHLRVRVMGSAPAALEAKVWPLGGAEPATWTLAVTDSTPALQKPGASGLFAYLGGDTTNAPVAVAVDDLSVRTAQADPPATGGDTGGDGPVQQPPNALPAPARPTHATGAAPLGTTAYPVPAGAVFVAPTGSDTAAGTSAAPVRTLARAVKLAPAGGTVVLRAGTYHESVETPYGKRLTIQNAPHEAVWLDGSRPVTGFVADGGAWRKDGWTARFDATDPTAAHPDPQWRMVDSAYPMAAHPDMVFVDGAALRQVGSRAEVVAGTFFVDYATQQLWLGSDPAGRQVAASELSGGLYVNKGHGSVVRGIGVRRFATALQQYGTLKLFADDVVVQDVVVQDNAMRGVGVGGHRVVVRSTSVTRNGQTGFAAYQSDDLQVLGSDVSGNNTEHFRAAPEAGGLKVTSSRRVTVRDSSFDDNVGNGVWFDNSTRDVTIVGNWVLGNSNVGIQYEISGAGVVADNQVHSNGAYGIHVVESNDVKVYNNTLVRNRVALDVKEGVRVGTNASTPGHDPRYGPDPSILWDVRRVVVRNNLFVSGPDKARYLVGVDDATRTLKGTQMLSMDHDAYYQEDFANPEYLVAWADYGTGGGMKTFLDLEGLRAAAGQEASGVAVLGVPVSPFVDAPQGDYRLAATSPARGAGQPLPADVAAAVGASAGTAVDIGVLQP